MLFQRVSLLKIKRVLSPFVSEHYIEGCVLRLYKTVSYLRKRTFFAQLCLSALIQGFVKICTRAIQRAFFVSFSVAASQAGSFMYCLGVTP